MEKNKDFNFLKDLFGKKRVLTIKELVDRGKKSAITIRRKLKNCGGLTSYNKNGMYYTLPHIPVFNSLGLWEYQEVRFSKFGNLNKTIVGLIQQSESGLSADQLTEYIGSGPHFLLNQLYLHSIVSREKLNGRYIYFDVNEEHRAVQLEHYRTTHIKIKNNSISNAVAVKLLIAKIKNPKETISGLVKSLQPDHVDINESQVNQFFEKHSLEKKTSGLSTSV